MQQVIRKYQPTRGSKDVQQAQQKQQIYSLARWSWDTEMGGPSMEPSFRLQPPNQPKQIESFEILDAFWTLVYIKRVLFVWRVVFVVTKKKKKDEDA